MEKEKYTPNKVGLAYGIWVVGLKLKIPKVILDAVRDYINECVEAHLPKKLEKWDLLIIAVFTNKHQEITMIGPSRNNHDKVVTYQLHLPYQRYMEGNYNEYFIDDMFNNIMKLLSEKFDMDILPLEKVRSEIKEEFLK